MKYWFIILMLLLSPLAMCQEWYTTLEILHPAPQSLPDDVIDLLVVNNTVQQPLDMGHSILQDSRVIGYADVDLSEATTRLIFSAARSLDDSRMFASVGLIPESQNNTGNFTTRTLLNQTQIDSLCAMYEVDGALVCNQLILYDVVGSFLTTDYDYYAYQEAYVVSHWSLQTPAGYNHSFICSDTLYWEATADARHQAIAKLPNRQEALIDMAYWVGEQLVNEFTPTWSTVNRYLYQNDNKGIKKGFEAFRHRRWQDATEIWSAVYETNCQSKRKTDKITCAYAAANAAVGHELAADTKAARQWAQKAVDAFAEIGTAEANQQWVNMQYYLNQLIEN